jgi:3-hydroxyacyl-[acyl-carrier-protein] dehydratase
MQFVIAPDHPALPGHFPGRPIVPGVVILDQVLAAIESAHGPLGPLRLPQVKFVQPLLPGESALVTLETMAPVDGTPASRWRFQVECAGALLASGEVVRA